MTGCGLGGRPSGGPARTGSGASAARATPTAPGAPLPAYVWVLPAVGLNLRSAASSSSSVVVTLGQGVELQVTGQSKDPSSGATWLQVKSQSGDTGYVLEDPGLVINQAVAPHSESNPSYSNLYPATWTLQSGNPAIMQAPPADGSGSLMIQTASTLGGLPSVPLSPGNQMGQQPGVVVYGVTTSMTTYSTTSGGWEYVVEVNFQPPGLAMLLDFKEPKSQGNSTALFLSLISSVWAAGAI